MKGEVVDDSDMAEMFLQGGIMVTKKANNGARMGILTVSFGTFSSILGYLTPELCKAKIPFSRIGVMNYFIILITYNHREGFPYGDAIPCTGMITHDFLIF